MYLLANNLIAQNQIMNDSVFMGLKLPPNDEKVNQIKTSLENEFNSNWSVFGIWENRNRSFYNPNLKIFDNRMQFSKKNGKPIMTIYFDSIIGKIKFDPKNEFIASINIDYKYYIMLRQKDSQSNKIFYTNLIFLLDVLKKAQTNYKTTIMNNQLDEFKMKSLEYFSKEVNPSVSEDQRKFVVQANAANEQKKYDLALEMYEKVFQINPYTYPQGYFNAALIAAQLEDYTLAIFNMKKYLIISPDAEDARKAQDKIYEWELNIEKL
jgi:tetratricopeptide (TPR) repeat protein